jgi:hypothetical protein
MPTFTIRCLSKEDYGIKSFTRALSKDGTVGEPDILPKQQDGKRLVSFSFRPKGKRELEEINRKDTQGIPLSGSRMALQAEVVIHQQHPSHATLQLLSTCLLICATSWVCIMDRLV